jgi:predicted ATPase with chaperone activity
MVGPPGASQSMLAARLLSRAALLEFSMIAFVVW